MRETGTTVMLGVPTLYALLRDDIERRVLGASRSQLRSNLMETGKRLARSWERRFDRSIGRQVFVRVHQALGGRLRFLVSGGSRSAASSTRPTARWASRSTRATASPRPRPS